MENREPRTGNREPDDPLRLPMRALTSVFFIAAIVASSAACAAGAVPAPADVSRTIEMVFFGDPGAAGGDVNADGRANAADVSGVLLGMRSPTQAGPFGVGLRRMTFVKESVTNPGQQRRLNTDIWYPADPGTGPIDPNIGARANAPLAAGAANFPLLLFSHGSCGFSRQSIFLTATVASYGFIVAAPPHPGNTSSELATCMEPAQLTDSFANRPADISFVIDSLLVLNTDPASFFYGAIDPNRIGMSGHSYGGLTTLRVSAADARVIAALALAPVATGIEPEVAQIHIPAMIQVGTLDGLLEDARLAYDLLRPPRYALEIARMTHSPFSDFCLECGPDTLLPDEAHLYVLRYAIPFLLHWLAGDGRFDPFLAAAAAPTGATFIADPGPE
jgi:dienelactone hydrolase